MLRARIGNVARRLRDDYQGNVPRAVSRELFFRGARRFTPALVAETNGMRFHVKTYDRALGLRTFANGPPEQETMALALALLGSRGEAAKPADSTFLEIGANIGTATITALGEGFRDAICFEPLPENYALLLDNLAANGFSERAKAMPLALSDHDGQADFEISPNNSGDGRVRAADAAGAGAEDAFDEASRQVVAVELAKLDSLCERGVLDLGEVGLTWIDAQGHEGHILAGAQKLLDSGIPVVTEFWPYGLNRSGGREALVEAIRSNYGAIVDLGCDDPLSPTAKRGAGEIESLFSDYERGSFLDPGGVNASTDLLLLKDA